MSRIQYEIQLFCAALTFLTRIPLPRQNALQALYTPALYTPEIMAACCRYYPLVGAIVGSMLALVFVGTHALLPLAPSVVITLIVGILLTGAFHEDGLADTCDGLGGGWSREDALRIMKDSRVGSYAVIGLTLALALKITLLASLPPADVVAALIVAHTLSRTLALSYLLDFPYVQLAEHSKVGTYARASISAPVFFAVALAGLLLTAWLLGPGPALACTVSLAAVRRLFGRYLLRRLGGITGDCLGAAQQIGEVLVYGIAVALHGMPI